MCYLLTLLEELWLMQIRYPCWHCHNSVREYEAKTKAVAEETRRQIEAEKERKELERKQEEDRLAAETRAEQERIAEQQRLEKIALEQKQQEEARLAEIKRQQEEAEKTRLKAEEDARNRDIGIQLDLEEVAGAQQAAADAAVARSQAIAAGMESTGNAIQGATQLAPLYQQNLDAQKAATYKAIGQDDAGMVNLRKNTYRGQELGLIDYNAMSNRDWRQFKNALSPEQSMQLFQSQPYLKSYNPNLFSTPPINSSLT